MQLGSVQALQVEDLVDAAQTALSDDLDQENPGAIHGAGDAEQGGGHEPVTSCVSKA